MFHCLSAVLGAHEFPHSPQTPSDPGIKVVFDGIVGAE